MAGVLLSRLPTLTVIILTALFFALITLVILPKPAQYTEKHSVRAKHEAEAALREANESVMVAATMPRPEAIAAEQLAADHTAPVAGDAPHETMPHETPPQDGEAGHVASPEILAELPHDDLIKLAPAPDKAVADETPEGILPVIAEDGRQPWRVYARPYAEKNLPHIVIVLAGLGADKTVTNAAIERLPSTITLAIDAQWAGKDDVLARARRAGHETLLALPAEPFDYPNSDPGPDTLLTNLTARENLHRLQGFLRQGSGYVGVVTISGTRFLSVPSAVQVLLDETAKRGLALLDARITERGGLAEQAAQMKLPVGAVDFKIQGDMALPAIDQVLAQAEVSAKKSGHTVCLVTATPLIIDRLNHWLLGLPNSGIKIAPFSAVLQ